VSARPESPLGSVSPARPRAISLATIEDAAATIHPVAARTPLVRLDPPGEARRTPDGRALEVFLKLETLQPIGSFKIRGAYNAMRQLSPRERASGVWTVSAGNAAQGVALAARVAGLACSVMVIETAPQAKLRAIERLGASIVEVSYDEAWATVERHGSDRMRGVFIHPFDDDRFISGNGTVGLEIVEDLPEVDAVVAAVGGGGLLGGVACALRARRPEARVYAAEPETAAPLATSLAAGGPRAYPNWRASFVDGAGGKSVLPSMWPLLSGLDGSIVVTLDQAARAMREVADRVHVVAEGAAACAVAAALSGRAGGGKVVAVVSGGNVDLTTFASLVGACPPFDS
jgi:threonine dehydratase